MKRILLVTDIFPPEIGGPATFIDHLAHELSQRGYVVTVVCSSTSREREPSDDERPFRVLRIFVLLWAIHVYMLVFILAWQMLGHDLVLVNGSEYSVYWASRITRRGYLLKIVGDTAWEDARGNGLTTLNIDDFQEIGTLNGRVKRLRDWRQMYLTGASKVIVPSEYLKRLVLGWGIPKDKIRTIYNGVSLPAGPMKEPRHRPFDNALQVIFVGRLTNWKGVETLLLATSKLDNLEVHIVGEGPEYPILSGLSQQLNISPRIKFWGTLRGQVLSDMMRKMDVLVLGSSYEGLSHTLLEACAIGLPCVASSSGGNTEIIKHLENGLLFPYGDVDMLAASLKMLRDNEQLRFDMALRARDYVKNFDFSKTIEQTIQALLELN